MFVKSVSKYHRNHEVEQLSINEKLLGHFQ